MNPAATSRLSRSRCAEGENAGLADRLADLMAREWSRGNPVRVEALLAQHPEWNAAAVDGVQLVYEEYCLRQERGERVDLDELAARFPQWRDELHALFEVHQALTPAPAESRFPRSGDVVAEFRVQAELGRGAVGRVFLASQPALADRLVVLKLTPSDGGEHFALARLQHTHVVPLYSAQDLGENRLRVLCMPYLGGATLARVLETLRDRQPPERTGRDLLDALDQSQPAQPACTSLDGPCRRLLQRASYTDAVSWIGACLADALHYAHERELVHFDLKPTNVLLATDGQPMLLDFHLARPPVRPGGPPPSWLGGSSAYMSPEQREAMAAIREGRPVAAAVDGRSDIYSLGLVLYEALGGSRPGDPGGTLRRLERCNPQVSPGLGDIIRKCLAVKVSDRYRDAAALAADLRRHLTSQPLHGVRNRSLRERWRKWRARRPHALAVASLLIAMLCLSGLAGATIVSSALGRVAEARSALQEGARLFERQRFPEAVAAFTRGGSSLHGLPGCARLRAALDQERQRARRAVAAEALHDAADQLRLLQAVESAPRLLMRTLAEQCQAAWATYRPMMTRDGAELPAALETQVQRDLLDVALLGSELRVRVANDADRVPALQQALRTLEEAEASLPPSAALYLERQRYAGALGLTRTAQTAANRAAQLAPRTAWEHFVVGRDRLQAGKLESAAEALDRAIELEPQGFWWTFYRGVCAYRAGQPAAAIARLSTAIALSPRTAEAYYDRALAYSVVGDDEHALRDCDRALELQRQLAPAVFHRGILRLRAGQHQDAVLDLQSALAAGADRADVCAVLTRAYLAQGNLPAARESLEQTIAAGLEPAKVQALAEEVRSRGWQAALSRTR